MEFGYYLFAFFVFVLLCIIIFICRSLFSDVKRQNKLLDEKETKLLRLYQTVEDSMDEFYDLVAEAKAEIEEKYKIMSSLADAVAEETSVPVIGAPKKDTKKKAAEALPQDGREKEFAAVLADAEEADEMTPIGGVREIILELAEEGKTHAQIAKQLNITRNEVELVIGMNRK